MSAARRVALEGFTPFERSTLASCLRLAAGRALRYEEAPGLDRCDLVLADADRPAVVAAIRAAGLLPVAVFVGSRSPDGAGAWMPRPIDPLTVLRQLDGLAAQVRLPTPMPDLVLGAPALPALRLRACEHLG